MKVKRKKIVARVGAMVAAVLLVALCALPAFADGTETRTTTAYDDYLSVIGATADDAIYHLMRDNSNYSPMVAPIIYQFGISTTGSLPVSQYITWDGSPYALRSVTTAYNTDTNEVIHLPNGVWRTSHTTTSGNKFVYLDYVNLAVDGTATRIFRIRYKYVSQQLTETQITVEGSLYSGLESNISSWQFATTVATNGFVLGYAADQRFITPVGGLPLYNSYNNFQTIYDGAYAVGEQEGYGYGYREGYGVGSGVGYDQGFIEGENFGYAEGYEYGFGVGESEGYDEGYDVGFNAGRNFAHDEELGQSTTAIVDLVTAVFRAPMEFLDAALDFTILGVDMAVAVRVLISMAIIGVVVTFIWKAVK